MYVILQMNNVQGQTFLNQVAREKARLGVLTTAPNVHTRLNDRMDRDVLDAWVASAIADHRHALKAMATETGRPWPSCLNDPAVADNVRLFAKKGERVLGMLSMVLDAESPKALQERRFLGCELHHIHVVEDARRKGVANDLISYARNFLRNETHPSVPMFVRTEAPVGMMDRLLRPHAFVRVSGPSEKHALYIAREKHVTGHPGGIDPSDPLA